MAGYSEKDIDTEEEWIPPTEAELKVIQARRDRSDRISKIMGSYLLKGYKMLASECPTCGTIELQDKKNKIYCIACEEIDTDIQKDNPALSEKAASSQRAEYQFMTERNQSDRRIEPSAITALQTPVTTTLQPSILKNDVSSKTQYKSTVSILTSTMNVEEECLKCLEVVHKKITWARFAVENEHDPNLVSSYLKVITNGVEALNVLRKFSP
ncbi:protein ZNRD2-like [Daphnia pulex]|uniref:Sjoegren syndrome/scleroderma autoantigen n=1 Tax=Daphnia pulex TaxID=6669 RepID=E9GAR2_DAPPU|nr:protein ZNRD2-like [Daphnia pulex]XP_046444503.1 protein ZNRD2-like [Daphnia pulex]EFX83495.1 hypothetical protein DAPPUDRAFT_315759 [Daphnia pulex]|eukprot:EFX83495.1 hypothetical protein DAPPUDRAFT_315759 [Daphnia pulex]